MRRVTKLVIITSLLAAAAGGAGSAKSNGYLIGKVGSPGLEDGVAACVDAGGDTTRMDGKLWCSKPFKHPRR